MCGIAGVWNFDGRSVGLPVIDRFTDALVHRGPDGRGTWRDDTGTVALGHRRLAILDLSTSGEQPMSYANGRLWITFNGEIYNFLELRQELEARGHHFRSDSDTEVILAAYLEWGPEMLGRFNGMWALGIFDVRERTLFLARDRFGIKPLLYLKTAARIAFASELKAFGQLDGHSPSVDADSAAVFLHTGFGLEGTHRTMLSGVERVPAGHYAVIREGRITLVRWWNTLDHLMSAPSGFDEQAAAFRDLFDDSVRLRMRSDVSIGTCLSGGFDSSAVVCTLAELGSKGHGRRQASDWHRSFVATFPGAANDERDKAELVIRFTGLQSYWLPISDSDALSELDQVLFDFDDVYLALPTAPWMIYRELRRAGVFVSLDGHGGDELMAGYPPYDWLFFQDAPALFSHPFANWNLVREQVRTLQSLNPRLDKREGRRSALQGLMRFHPSLDPLRRSWRRLRQLQGWRPPAGVSRFLRRPSNSIADDFRLPIDDDVLPTEWGTINRTLYRYFHGTILPTILRNIDRVSMAHGVESRMPFMDWRLVTLLFSLPSESKIAHGYTKRIAREALRGRMPETIRASRAKIGFHSPLPEWLNGPLIPWVRRLLGAPEIRDHSLIDMPALAAFFEQTASMRSWTWQNCEMLWPFLSYLWFERHFPALSALGGQSRAAPVGTAENRLRQEGREYQSVHTPRRGPGSL
jgi:asparagine synthase (glutamine-hydrolysing)